MAHFDLLHDHIARQLAPKPSGNPPSRRLIIEHGGYRPATAGPVAPPHKVENGCRPTASGSANLPTPLASADDIREAIEVLEVQAKAHGSVGAQAGLIRANQLRRVIKLLRDNLHRVGG